MTTLSQRKAYIPKSTMEDFLEGRENAEAYGAFFDYFVPCVTKKTTWERRLEQDIESQEKTTEILCSKSDEALALLLLENSHKRWLDLYTRKKRKSHPAKRAMEARIRI